MALTEFQRALLRVPARNRPPNSVLAGGATLNRRRVPRTPVVLTFESGLRLQALLDGEGRCLGEVRPKLSGDPQRQVARLRDRHNTQHLRTPAVSHLRLPEASNAETPSRRT